MLIRFPTPEFTHTAESRHSVSSPLDWHTPGTDIDVHLVIDLHGVILHFAASVSAASQLMADERQHHYFDSVSVAPGTGVGLPRLPCEQLYLGP